MLDSAKQSNTFRTLEAMRLEVLPFDADGARQAGDIRAALTAARIPVRSHDLLIAGQARARDLVLVTHDIRKFARVDGLWIEDWQTATHP